MQPSSSREKLNPRRERRKEQREAARRAKQIELQQAIAAEVAKISQRKIG